MESNVKKFVQVFGLNNVGFLTLTFADNITDPAEAQRRYRSLEHHFLAPLFGERLLVKERQKRGAWHYHLLIDCKTDIRTGFDFEAIKHHNYKSASPDLRIIWSKLRMGLKKYGFGRHELLPIKSNDEAIAKYVGKYLSKHVNARTNQDKGVRLTSCSAGFAKSVTSMSWNSDGAKEWRRKVAKFAEIMGIKEELGISLKYGPRWAYHLHPLINAIDGLSPLAIPDMVLSFLSHAIPWQPSKDLIRRQDHACDVILDGDILFLKSPDFRDTGQVYELF